MMAKKISSGNPGALPRRGPLGTGRARFPGSSAQASCRRVVAEHQPGRPERGERAQRGQRRLPVKVGRRRGRPDVPGIRKVHTGRIAGVQVTGIGVEQADASAPIPSAASASRTTGADGAVPVSTRHGRSPRMR